MDRDIGHNDDTFDVFKDFIPLQPSNSSEWRTTTPVGSQPLLDGPSYLRAQKVLLDDSLIIPTEGFRMTGFHVVTYRVVVPIVFSLITITGLVGNLLVLFVIISKKQMRTVTNILILNLAFADLLFISFVPLLTAFDYWHYSAWTIGLSACRFMHFIFSLTTYVTVSTLVLISIIRYMVVVQNAATLHLRTKKHVSLAILVVWVMSFSFSMPVPFFYNVQVRCDVDFVIARKLALIFFFVGYIIPLIIIGVLYLCIIKHMYKHRTAATLQTKTRGRSEAKTKQAGKMLMLVLVAFFLLWMPIHVQLIFYHYNIAPQSNVFHIIGLVFNCLAYTNSVVNPFIYNHSSKDFRDAFKEVVCFRPSETCTPPICCQSQKTRRLSYQFGSRCNLGTRFDEELANHNSAKQVRLRSVALDSDSLKDDKFVLNDSRLTNCEDVMKEGEDCLGIADQKMDKNLTMPKSRSLNIITNNTHVDGNSYENVKDVNHNQNNDGDSDDAVFTSLATHNDVIKNLKMLTTEKQVPLNDHHTAIEMKQFA